jgi:hypothetical protein
MLRNIPVIWSYARKTIKSQPKKFLDLINTFNKGSGYKINAQKSVAFLYTNNEQSDKEIRKTIPFTITSKNLKYLGIDLTKDVIDLYNEKHKSLKKQINEHIRRLKDIHGYLLMDQQKQ